MNSKRFSSSGSITISDALNRIHQDIQGFTDTPKLDAQVLLAHISGKNRAWVLAHPEHQLTNAETDRLDEAVSQISSNIPLPYVIGKWEFFKLPFIVTPDVLIPRPETELLVETAIEWLTANPQRNLVAEAGTGSGCIAVSIAVNLPAVNITTTDISPEAAAVARKNAALHQVSDRVKILNNDLLSGLPGQFDLICANLPYISSDELRHLPIYTREPTIALDGGADGLVIINKFIEQAAKKLSYGGMVLMEIQAGQSEEVTALASNYFPQATIHTKLDLARRHRLLTIENK